MFAILVSMLAGVFIVVSRIINYNLSKRIGIFQGTLFNYVIGLFFSFVFLLISGEFFHVSFINLQSLPLFAYLGGTAGVLVIVLFNYITPKMSAFYLTLFVFIGQLFLGIIVDCFTLNELSPGKIIGGLLVLLGLSYNLIIDKKREVLDAPEI